MADIDDSVVARFWRGVDKRGPNECWEWRGAKHHWGHGAVDVKGKSLKAHRLAYEILLGPIPNGVHVLHRCDNPPCCNPNHLHLGTQADNMREMVERGRSARGERIGISKLTDEAVSAIRSGMPIKDAMAKFGVSMSTAYNARRGKTWAHVD